MDNRSIDPNAVYEPAEAAYLARCGKNTLLKLARRGDIDSVHMGAKVVRFTGRALLQFLHSGGTTTPVNEPADNVRRLPRQKPRRTGGGG